MIQDVIRETLEKKGYRNISGNKEIADSMLIFHGENVKFCSIVKNYGGNSVNYNEMFMAWQKLSNKLLLTGSKVIDSLFIIVTDKYEDVQWLQDNGMNFWIIDLKREELLIYENQPDDFDDLKSTVEKALDEGIEITNQKKEKLNFPVVTIALIAINILVYILAELFGSTEDTKFMMEIGACSYEYVIFQREFYRMITCMFLHFGIEHIANNMFMLGVLGYELEPKIGRWKFFAIYMASGIFASLSSVVFHFYMEDNCVSAGASGAIYGIFGVLIVLLLQDKDRRKQFGTGRIAFVVFLIVFGSFQANIDFMAHIGGFAAGVVLALVLCNNQIENGA